MNWSHEIEMMNVLVELVSWIFWPISHMWSSSFVYFS